jgi:hypothetical protein
MPAQPLANNPRYVEWHDRFPGRRPQNIEHFFAQDGSSLQISTCPKAAALHDHRLPLILGDELS